MSRSALDILKDEISKLSEKRKNIPQDEEIQKIFQEKNNKIKTVVEVTQNSSQSLYLPSYPDKRIDYVLTFQDDEKQNALQYYSDQTVSKTRQVFKENLENNYGFIIEEFISKHLSDDKKVGNTCFYLLHLPFKKLSKHAERLQIIKNLV